MELCRSTSQPLFHELFPHLDVSLLVNSSPNSPVSSIPLGTPQHQGAQSNGRTLTTCTLCVCICHLHGCFSVPAQTFDALGHFDAVLTSLLSRSKALVSSECRFVQNLLLGKLLTKSKDHNDPSRAARPSNYLHFRLLEESFSSSLPTTTTFSPLSSSSHHNPVSEPLQMYSQFLAPASGQAICINFSSVFANSTDFF